MLYHCGLLDDDRLASRSFTWVKRKGWFRDDFPADVRHELAVWLAMPGFDARFHVHNLRVCEKYLKRAREELCGDFEALRADVAANWLSATRDDCLALAHMRVGKAAGMPLICQLRILDDLKAGLTQKDAGRVWGITERWVATLSAKRGPLAASYWRLPPGFELLVGPQHDKVQLRHL